MNGLHIDFWGFAAIAVVAIAVVSMVNSVVRMVVKTQGAEKDVWAAINNIEGRLTAIEKRFGKSEGKE